MHAEEPHGKQVNTCQLHVYIISHYFRQYSYARRKLLWSCVCILV